MKAIIIARVSTEEQKEAGNSLPAQIERLKKHCQSKGFEIVKEFSFDESAYKDHRDDFDNILDYVIGQKEKIIVCFDKVDRLSRNIFDKRVSLLYEKALKDEIELHFVSDGQVINSQLSAVEKFNFSMSLGLAKYYSDAISDNVKRAQEQILRSGRYPHSLPYGYKKILLDDGKNDYVIDEYASRIVQKVFEWYATGAFSMNLILDKLKKEYGIKWSKSFLDKILKDTFYYGLMIWKGKTHKHGYPTIITYALFEQAQQVKASHNKKKFKYAGLPYIYRGLIRCNHCGLAITPEKHKGHVYYHCTEYNGKHGAKWLKEEAITEQIGQVFKKLRLPDHVMDKVINALKNVHEDKNQFRDKQYEELSKEHQLYASRSDKLYVDKLDGRITDDAYDRYYQSFRDKIAEIDARLALLQDAEDNYYITVKYLLDIAKRANDLFVRSEVEEKRQIIKLILPNLRMDGDTLRYEAQKPFDSLLAYADSKGKLPRLDSNQQPSD